MSSHKEPQIKQGFDSVHQEKSKILAYALKMEKSRKPTGKTVILVS
jgi:hypothetical protein